MLATYGDKLLEASTTGRVRAETAELAEILSGWREPGSTARAGSQPTLCRTPPRRCRNRCRSGTPRSVHKSLRERVAAIDAKLETVDGLWIARAPAELRGGIGLPVGRAS